jgi:hypothetical protein
VERVETDRVLENEKLFVRANDRILAAGEKFKVEPVPFLCECSAVTCTELIPLSLEDYRRVRAGEGFMLRPGHDDPHFEQLVDDCGGYIVVEKFR